jgi:dipeptidyl aminopeptidase/acylaminoacyl peptidase
MAADSGGVTTKPYGAWASPVSAASLAEGAISLAELRVAGGQIYWLESRPAEGGRMVAMTRGGAGVHQLTPEGFNVRTRVHEYGGGSYVVAPDGIWFSHFRDQKLYRQGDGTPEPLTPEPYRYADAVPHPAGGLVAVREDHTDPAHVRNAVVRLTGQPGDGGAVLFGDSDFVAYPRLSPDGKRLCWIAWDFPAMPWDATRLYVAELTPTGLANVRQVAGGADISSVVDPQWSDDGTLAWISDETGWWNLYDDRGGKPRALQPESLEFGGPLWQLGQSNYALVAGDRILAAVGEAGGDRLWLLGRDGGAVRKFNLPFLGYAALHPVDGNHVAMIAGSATETAAVIVVDVETGAYEVVAQPSPTHLAERYVSVAEPISFPSANGRIAHALYYPPRNDDFRAPNGETPPLIVQAHGGPTGAASGAFSLSNQFWTSRGFAVVDVDYGGSTGYGRAYRQLLNDRWGVVDVEDVIAAAQFLTGTGRADPKRVAIHGGSAGGFTTLAALAQSDVFGAGGDFYGVSDLEALARDTHKFESRYLDNLIGPWPAAKAIYDARSPINHLEGFKAPLIIFQGSEDPVVPPNQAHMIRDALKARGVPVAYLEFPGEGHGFRRAEHMIRAKEAELAFYGRVFGFKPADDLPPVDIENAEALG